MLQPVSLPGLTIPGNIFLAPLAGYTDAAFRTICREQGAWFTFTEMVSAEACFRKNQKTLNLLTRAETEAIYGIQLFAADAAVAAAALEAILPFGPAVIDLNCGCSIPKILRSGCGAALLREPDKIAAIVRALKQETSLPITVKFRSGWDHHSLNYLEVGEKAVAAGAAMLTLHPRTRSQVFSGSADRTHLRELAQRIRGVPVIGSGDLFTAGDVQAMLQETGCAGVMLARGAIGNPFLFRQVRELLEGNQPPAPVTAREILELTLRQLRLAVHYKGEERACKEMRKQFCAYTRGLPGSAALRQLAVRAATYNDYASLIEDYLAADRHRSTLRA